MSIILNIETSGTACSVALSREGKVQSYKETETGKSHASMLSPYIDQVMEESGTGFKDIDAVAVSKGPGSYTGLRIGVSTAKGIAYALKVPLIGINTLQLLTYGFLQHYPEYVAKQNILFCPMLDARRMEVYTCLYSNKMEAITEITAEIINGDSFKSFLESGNIIFFGGGAKKCEQVINHRNAIFFDFGTLSARFMNILSLDAFKAGYFEDLAYFEPFYLKDFIAGKPKKSVLLRSDSDIV